MKPIPPPQKGGTERNHSMNALITGIHHIALNTASDAEYRRVRDHMLALDLPGFLQEPDSADRDFVPVFNRPESFF